MSDRELARLERKIKALPFKEKPITFLDIIDKKEEERIVTKYVAFLLNPQNTNAKVIEEILKVTSSTKDETEFVQLMPATVESVETEESISANSIVDILIRFSSFWIVIENKINSGENNEQSKRYESDIHAITSLPVKYICLKPQYNTTKMVNEKFTYLSYQELAGIFKKIKKNELAKKENSFYLKDFVNYVEAFLMTESNIQIDENVKFFIQHQEKMNTILKDYQQQCELVVQLLKQKMERQFCPKYQMNFSKSGYIQIWKKQWEYHNDNGIHYELLCDWGQVISKETEVTFAIHNEGQMRNIYSEVKNITFHQKYHLDTEKNIEESISQMVMEMQKLINENDDRLDQIIQSQRNEEK